MDIQNQTKNDYPVHHEDVEIHPRGANIKKCELCEDMKKLTQKDEFSTQTIYLKMEENSFHLVCERTFESKWHCATTNIKITNCPCCGRKL